MMGQPRAVIYLRCVLWGYTFRQLLFPFNSNLCLIRW